MRDREIKSTQQNSMQEKTESNEGAFMIPPAFYLTASPLQQKPAAQLSGSTRGVCTDFGNFTIYSDNFVGPLPGSVRGEDSWPIRQSDYNNLITKLRAVKAGTSKFVITGDTEFKTATYLDLGWLMTSGVGQQLVNELVSTTYTVTVEETAGGNEVVGFGNGAWQTTDTPPESGSGSNATVKYNPNRLQIGDGSEDWMTRPPAIGLAHEMIHAWSCVHGTLIRGKTSDDVLRAEEQATGINDYADLTMSENRFRAAFNLPHRDEY